MTIRHSGPPRAAGDAPGAGAGHGRSSAIPPARRSWPDRAAVRALLAAVAFVLGLAVGGVVVGFAMTGREAPLPRRTVTATPVPAAPRAGVGARSPLGGVAVVNKACLRAINDNQTASAGLGDLVPALRALDAARIDRVLLELQSRQAQLQQDLRLCQVSGRLETATPAPSGSGH